MESLTVTCRYCGKQIQIPQGLAQFSCVYCGEKMTLEEVRPKKDAPLVREEDRLYVDEHLIDCVRNYPEYAKHFTKKDFENSFFAYRHGISETFEVLDRYIRANYLRREELIEQYARQFIVQREEYLSQDRRYQHKTTRSRYMFDNKLTLCWFTIPAIRHLNLTISEDFAQAIHDQYVLRYPGDDFTPGTFNELAAGFRNRKLCFITTAVCAFEGKPDNCPELESFRHFRDTWLCRQEGGQALIDQYYEIAPMVVACIDYADNRAARYQELRQRWLDACYQAIGRGENERCRDIYIDMVQTLEKRYGLDQ